MWKTPRIIFSILIVRQEQKKKGRAWLTSSLAEKKEGKRKSVCKKEKETLEKERQQNTQSP